jgi:hypothetical protein
MLLRPQSNLSIISVRRYSRAAKRELEQEKDCPIQQQSFTRLRECTINPLRKIRDSGVLLKERWTYLGAICKALTYMMGIVSRGLGLEALASRKGQLFGP